MTFWSRTALISVCLALLMMIMAILVEVTPLGANPWMRVFFGVSALNFTLRAAIPLVLGALSGILCERSGIINIVPNSFAASLFVECFCATLRGNRFGLPISLVMLKVSSVAGRASCINVWCHLLYVEQQSRAAEQSSRA